VLTIAGGIIIAVVFLAFLPVAIPLLFTLIPIVIVVSLMFFLMLTYPLVFLVFVVVYIGYEVIKRKKNKIGNNEKSDKSPVLSSEDKTLGIEIGKDPDYAKIFILGAIGIVSLVLLFAFIGSQTNSG
jgi:hypothetical protein